MPRCPNCRSPMTRVEEDAITSHSCANCFGTWITNIALLRRVRLDAQNSPADAPQSSLSDLAEIVSASDSQQALRCPQCEKPMTKDRYHPMIPVQIDRCKPCGCVWLDAGEFSLIRRLYVELMTSDDPEIVRRRDKVASAMSAWEGRRVEQTFGPGDGFDDGFDTLGYLMRRLGGF